MTTSAVHPNSCIANTASSSPSLYAQRTWQALATRMAGVLQKAVARQESWRHAQALNHLDPHVLRDMGAPHWLQQRSHLRRALEQREQFEAQARFRY
jgi:site-specific recombinase XerC